MFVNNNLKTLFIIYELTKCWKLQNIKFYYIHDLQEEFLLAMCLFMYCSYWSKLLFFYFQKIVAYNSLEFYVVLLHILGNIELNTSGFIEIRYFENLKTRSNITAPHPFYCSHIHVTFMLNSLPISPLLCPEPLDIHFSYYHNSGVNIQHTV